MNGQVAEVIVYSKALNAAEVRIVLNHLAAKFGQELQSQYDYYGHGSYSEEVAGLGDVSSASAPGGESGPGVATSGSDTDAAESSILSLNGSLTDAFALFGHDGASASTYASSGNPDDAERIERTWRMDLTGTSSESFSASVDLSGVSLDANFDDFGLFVDGDGDFTTTDDQTFHDLQDDNADDTYEASNVSVDDGDPIAVAQINRKVDFATPSGNEFENTTSSPNAAATLSVNYVDGSAIDVDVTTTGDLDGSGCIEDGATDENSDVCSSGSNDNGDYEAGDGASTRDDDEAGSFNGDYRFDGDPGTPRDTTVTISGGTSSTTVDLELDNDGVQEQTEKFEVNVSSVSTGSAGLGSETTFTFSVFDDDWARDIKFADPDYTDGDDSDSNYSPISTEGDGEGTEWSNLPSNFVRTATGRPRPATRPIPLSSSRWTAPAT